MCSGFQPFIENVAAADIEVGNFRNPGHNSLLIQISDPGGWKPTSEYKFSKILQFEFLDIETVDLADDPALEDSIIQIAQAKEILAALLSAKEEGQNVIVHCYAGVSRSGAVVEFGKLLGFRDVGGYRSPNARIYEMLSDLYAKEHLNG